MRKLFLSLLCCTARWVKINSVLGKTVDDVFDGGYDVLIKPQDIITKGPWFDVRAYGSFSDAIDAIGSDNRTLLIPNEQSIFSDVIVPSNISIFFLKGGSLNVTSGVSVTINGSLISGSYQIFSGDGDIQFTHNDASIRAVWWGHSTANGYNENDAIIGKAMDGLPNGGTVKLLEGTYLHKLIEISNDIILQGCGYSTVIKLPDTLITGPGIGLCGITAEDGAEHVTVRDLQYNGNGSNNRAWIGSYNYDLIQAHGIYFGHHGGRTPPRYAQVENVYVHDVVRNNIVWGGGAYVQVRNSWLLNSEADHLLYCSTDAPGEFSDLLLEGYWRGPALISEGQNFSNITIRNIVQNPNDPTYKTITAIQERSSFSKRPGRFVNIYIENVDPQFMSSAIQWFGSLAIANLYVEQTGDNVRNFALVYGRSGLQNPTYLSLNGVDVQNVMTEGFSLLTIENTAGEECKNAYIDNVRIYYNESSANSNNFLFKIDHHFTNLAVRNLVAEGAGQALLHTLADKMIKDIYFKNVQMLDGARSDLMSLGSGSNINVVSSQFADTDISLDQLSKIHFHNCDVGGKHTEASGLATFDGGVSTFQIAHGLKWAPKVVMVTPASQDTVIDNDCNLINYFVSSNNTNITISTTNITNSGSNNVTFNWSAYVSSAPTT